ncbi:MAG TPA: pyruvate kinase [Vicinamibacterales bacterium]|nr:pyruvate kinase [Vicinamibacterales bacterium]
MADRAGASHEFQELIDEFLRLRRDMLRLAKDSRDLLDQVHPSHRESAENLLHYIALRSCDLRPLQMRLANAGLSSLGRAESHVLSAVDAVLAVLNQALGRTRQPDEPHASHVDLEAGQRLLSAHTEALLGAIPPVRGVAIMVTMPSEAADDYSLVHHLLEHGMDCMRINCAHDDEAAWARTLEHLPRAEQATRRRCRVLMDLAGPKLRTGPLEPGPAVIKFKPTRDAFGHVIRPARVWLSPEEVPRKPPTPADAAIEFPSAFLRTLHVGDRLTFADAREAKRVLEIVAVGGDGCWAESMRTSYLTAGIRVQARRDEAGTVAEACVAPLPPTPTAIALAIGDLLILTRELTPGRPAACDRHGRVLNPATIGCTSAQVFEDVRAGERIWFDDGRIGGVIERKEPDRLHVRVTHTRARGAKLVADKGINLPDSHLHLEAMTDKDRADLAFVANHADMVALSFVNTVEDVRALQALLAPVGDKQPAIVLKIETRRGFENLPAMLLEAMKAPRCGVMIARGDLAVECGFERLAEVQEEILWLCEAAHVPVIWATQVLESLAKDGQPSRAEITDAAMSHRAECVMLNKGPYVMEAVHVLDDILRRMHGHQAKKRSMLRELDLVTGFRRSRKTKAKPDMQLARPSR